MSDLKVELNNRSSAFVSLDKFDLHSNEHHYVEATLWTNGEGYDINIDSPLGNRLIQLTDGELKAISTLVAVL
jgi:hypothetical protein